MPEKSSPIGIRHGGHRQQQKRPATHAGTPLHDKKDTEDQDMRKEEKVVENPAS